MHCDILMIRWMRWPLRGYTAELCITYCTTSLNTIKMYWKHFKTLFGQAEPPAVRRLARCKKSAKASPDSWHVNCDKPTCSLCHIVSLSLYIFICVYIIYIYTQWYYYIHICTYLPGIHVQTHKGKEACCTQKRRDTSDLGDTCGCLRSPWMTGCIGAKTCQCLLPYLVSLSDNMPPKHEGPNTLNTVSMNGIIFEHTGSCSV